MKLRKLAHLFQLISPYLTMYFGVRTNKHEGLRVIKTQQTMHHKQDPHFGYVTIGDKEFYVREKSPYTKEIEPKHIKEYKDLKQTVETMAQLSAKILELIPTLIITI